jgi:hypothetical protein
MQTQPHSVQRWIWATGFLARVTCWQGLALDMFFLPKRVFMQMIRIVNMIASAANFAVLSSVWGSQSRLALG